MLLVLLLPEGAGVATAERSQRCKKQLALGQPPESRNRFQSSAFFLFLALLKLSNKKKKKTKNFGRLPSLQSSVGPPAVVVSTSRRAIALLFAVTASLQQRRNAATTRVEAAPLPAIAATAAKLGTFDVSGTSVHRFPSMDFHLSILRPAILPPCRTTVLLSYVLPPCCHTSCLFIQHLFDFRAIFVCHGLFPTTHFILQIVCCVRIL